MGRWPTGQQQLRRLVRGSQTTARPAEVIGERLAHPQRACAASGLPLWPLGETPRAWWAQPPHMHVSGGDG